MPVFLSPRFQLGMMAVVTVLIVCTVLLTRPGDDTILVPDPVLVVDAIEPDASTPLLTDGALSQEVSLDVPPSSLEPSTVAPFNEISGSMSFASPEGLFPQALSDRMDEGSDPDELFVQDILAGRFASDLLSGHLAPDLLSGPFECRDCTPSHSSVDGFRSGGSAGAGGVGGVGGVGAAGGGGSAWATGGPGDIPEDLSAEFERALFELSSSISGGGDQGGSDSGVSDSGVSALKMPSPDERNMRESPDLVASNDGASGPVSVPEPSTMALLGTGLAASMMRRGWARTRRD